MDSRKLLHLIGLVFGLLLFYLGLYSFVEVNGTDNLGFALLLPFAIVMTTIIVGFIIEIATRRTPFGMKKLTDETLPDKCRHGTPIIYDDTPERNMVGEFCVHCAAEFLEAIAARPFGKRCTAPGFSG